MIISGEFYYDWVVWLVYWGLINASATARVIGRLWKHFSRGQMMLCWYSGSQNNGWCYKEELHCDVNTILWISKFCSCVSVNIPRVLRTHIPRVTHHLSATLCVVVVDVVVVNMTANHTWLGCLISPAAALWELRCCPLPSCRLLASVRSGGGGGALVVLLLLMPVITVVHMLRQRLGLGCIWNSIVRSPLPPTPKKSRVSRRPDWTWPYREVLTQTQTITHARTDSSSVCLLCLSRGRQSEGSNPLEERSSRLPPVQISSAHWWAGAQSVNRCTASANIAPPGTGGTALPTHTGALTVSGGWSAEWPHGTPDLSTLCRLCWGRCPGIVWDKGLSVWGALYRTLLGHSACLPPPGPTTIGQCSRPWHCVRGGLSYRVSRRRFQQQAQEDVHTGG